MGKRNWFLMLALSLLAFRAFAGCNPGDSWRGSDKNMHFGLGAGIAAVATMHTGDPWRGFMVGAAAGLVKEVIDSSGMGQCSRKDLAVTLVGAALGAYAGNIIITRVQGRTVVAYATSF